MEWWQSWIFDPRWEDAYLTLDSHTQSHTHTHMLTKKVILVAESCGVWFLFCSFTGNRYVCVVCVCLCVDSLLLLFRVCSLNVVMVMGLHGMMRHTEIATSNKSNNYQSFGSHDDAHNLVVLKMLMIMVVTILLKKQKR